MLLWGDCGGWACTILRQRVGGQDYCCVCVCACDCACGVENSQGSELVGKLLNAAQNALVRVVDCRPVLGPAMVLRLLLW